MNVTRDGGRILIDMTVREAIRFDSFNEYASREGMDWSVDHAADHRELQTDEDTGRLSAGLVQARCISAALGNLVSWKEIDEVFSA